MFVYVGLQRKNCIFTWVFKRVHEHVRYAYLGMHILKCMQKKQNMPRIVPNRYLGKQFYTPGIPQGDDRINRVPRYRTDNLQRKGRNNKLNLNPRQVHTYLL